MHLILFALALFLACALTAAEHKGKVQFGGLPVPGATVTATQGDRTLVAVTDPEGNYSFADLPDGVWNFQVEMQAFAPIKQDVTITAGAGAPVWELKLLPFDAIKAIAGTPPPPQLPSISVTQPAATPAPANSSKNKKGQQAAAAPANQKNSFQRTAVNANPNAAPAPAESAAAEAVPANSPFASQSASDLSQRATDGLQINGTVNNGASSPFAQNARFGNNIRGPGSLYNGSIALIEDNSALDAKTFSYTGQDTPKPEYDHVTGAATFGGPIRIPRIVRNGPFFFVAYQWIRNHTAQTTPYIVPTAAEREGDFSSLAVPIYNPGTGAPFAGNIIPPSLISPVATKLLNFYPLPNLAGPSVYNFQIPIVGETHQNNLQARLNKNIGNKNQLAGIFAYQGIATDSPNEFGWLDKTSMLGLNAQANWYHSFTQRLRAHFQVQYSRQSNQAIPNFSNRPGENISQLVGIEGNNQEPVNYGPPSLNFATVSPLSDANASTTHNQTTAYTYDSQWNHGRHNISWGGDFKRLEFNSLGQQNPRGQYTFTGAYTAPPQTGTGVPVLGSDFADFLLGVPDTSSIAYGNADKYFRQSLWDGFLNDDWRVGPSLTVNYGGRWDYGAPITELYGRLVNLDVAPGFAGVAPVTYANPEYFVNPGVKAGPVGSLTGVRYPSSLLQPDKHGFEPRVGIAWRPIPASSLVIRAGYTLNYNTSVYQSIAQQMAQQSPLSTSFTVQNTASTLANGFTAPAGVVPNTFAIDPNFRVGYAQIWQVSAQRDLPGSLVMTATYQGIKGTRGPQEFLPNTYPTGAVDPCPSCPSGFIYMTSNGNSTREAGSLQLRRRLHNGILASATYTYSKSIDDSALGGRGQGTNVIAQNWLDLSAERGLSPFDQRHNLALQAQYTTGQGIGGGTLLSGWRGALFKEWTGATTINAGTGLPLTPTVQLATSGTGVPGVIRPDYTGAPLYAAPAGYGFNPAAFVLAPLGQWGNAGRDTVTGPDQFTVNFSLARTFRLKDRYNLDLRVDATNAINHVTFPSWNMFVNSAQFGLPAQPANAMRDLVTTLRLRF